MCLIVFQWQPASDCPLYLVANRDEFYARPTQPAHWWPGEAIWAGKDLQAGGSWLAIDQQGRWAALTNIRDGRRRAATQAPSRGELVLQFLRSGQSPWQFAKQLQAQLAAYAGFNLLLGDRQQLCFLSSTEPEPRLLGSGLYSLSNASLNSRWPKQQRAEQALQQTLQQPAVVHAQLQGLLLDEQPAADEQLPDTGVALAWERLLSPCFIRSADYGTRSTTSLILQQQGWSALEQTHGVAGQTEGQQYVTQSYSHPCSPPHSPLGNIA